MALIAAELQQRKAEAEVPERKRRIVALLERARELATPQDNLGDVTDNLLRLVYFYQSANQPYQAAILGEHIARTVKSTGGKSAAAGLMALNGYMSAAARSKPIAATRRGSTSRGGGRNAAEDRPRPRRRVGPLPRQGIS